MTAQAYAQPETTPIMYGELDSDGHIVVMFSGSGEDFAYASSMLSTLVPHFSIMKNPDGTMIRDAMRVPVSWPAVVQLAATFGASWRAGPALTQWISTELAARMNVEGGLTVAPPAGLVPYSWQITGARLIAATGTAYLNDEPGVGKTACTILGLVERAAAGHDIFPVIVVCPASVITHWVREFNAWAPWVRAVKWVGPPAKRRLMMGHHDVYVVGYETARRDAVDDTQKRSPLVHVKAVTVVADESQRLKSSTAAQTKAVLRLARKATNFIGLTGTPIAHSTRDITTTLEGMDHTAWPSSERFEQRFCAMGRENPSDYEEKNLGLRPEMSAQFWDCLLGQYRRVAKADVLSELPPKIYTVEQVMIPSPWREAYDNYEQDMLVNLPDTEEELEVFDVLAQIQHLTQLASAAGDVEKRSRVVADPETGLPIEKISQHIILKDDPPSWKIDKLIEIMSRHPGQPFATLAPSRQLMLLAGARAASLGYRVGYIVGGQSQTQRQAAIDGFQGGDLDLICVSTKAGGVGLTLTATPNVVFLQRPWSFIESTQAEDRFHRIGAEIHKQINIWDVVAANTIESRVRAVLKERAGAFSDFVRDPRIVAECLGGASVTRINAPRRSA